MNNLAIIPSIRECIILIFYAFLKSKFNAYIGFSFDGDAVFAWLHAQSYFSKNIKENNQCVLILLLM